MRKLLKKKLLAIVATLALLGWIVSSFFSSKHEVALPQIFSATGFENVALPKPERERGLVVYKDIPLDPDGFSTIGKMKIEYGLSGRMQSVQIENLSLTGELGDDLKITMAGWRKPSPAVFHGLSSVPNDVRISIQNAQIELLSETHGGIELRLDLEIQPGNDGREFQARLEGAQKQLSYDANVTGLITPSGIWQANIEIEQAKFDLGHLKSTRISGIINITGEKFGHSEVIGNLQAGGLTLLDLPWQNTAITLDGDLERTRMIIGAKSAGVDGMELGLTLGDIQQSAVYAGSLHCESISDLLQYLKINGALPFEGFPSGSQAETKSLDIEFRGNANAAVFDLVKEGDTSSISFLLKPAAKASGLTEILAGKPFVYERRTEEKRETMTLAITPNAGKIAILPGGQTATIDLQKLRIKEK